MNRRSQLPTALETPSVTRVATSARNLRPSLWHGQLNGPLVIIQAQSMLTELLPHDSILLSQILDELQLSLIHSPGNRHKQELEGIEHSRHLFPPIVATLAIRS